MFETLTTTDGYRVSYEWFNGQPEIGEITLGQEQVDPTSLDLERFAQLIMEETNV